jgi:hypothetical protein
MAFASFIKLFIYAISTLIKLVANILVFFGLYIPFFYLIYGGALYLFAGFRFMPYTPEVGLFFFGLALCALCAVIITVKNMLIKPLKAIFGRNEKEYEERHPRPRPYYATMRYDGGDYFPRPRPRIYPERSEQYGYLRIDSPREYIDRFDAFYEHPDVYRSEMNPDLIIYEYDDRFDVYRHNGDRLVFQESKYR